MPGEDRMSTSISHSDAEIDARGEAHYELAEPALAPKPAAAASTAASAGKEPIAEPPAPTPAMPRRKRRGRRRFHWKWDAPSWGVSLMVHAAVLAVLALMAVGGVADEIIGSIDASTVDTSLSEQQAEELMTIIAEPSADDRTLAVGDPLSLDAGGAAPSSTPSIRSKTAVVSETRSLKGLIDVAAPSPSTAMLPDASTLTGKFDGGSRINGETGRPTKDYGEAIDQLAREILAHLATSRVAVLWMFDESGSMKDDQQQIYDNFDRIVGDLRQRVSSDQRQAGDLVHAIIGYGQAIHFESSKPRADLEAVRQTIKELPVDESGEEQTMHAVGEAIGRYNRLVEKDRKVLLVLVTDESGDDGDLVEQARLALVNRNATVYVLGRQAMFGYERVHLRYEDPVTKDIYWPTIRRGPEAPGLELLQWDGLWKERNDEQPSGFAPYELARLVEETGGIFFLLPNEEHLRNHSAGERAYSSNALREYLPDYGPRPEYERRIAQSELRRTLADVIQITDADFGFERHFPVNPPELVQKVAQQLPAVDLQLRALLEFERRLRALEPARDKEADRRWQANYDLMLAMVVAFEVKAYEYRACLGEMATLAQQGKLVPKNPPIPDKRRTEWVVNHSGDPKAPESETEKKYAQARRLLGLVIERHPETPWAHLAQTTLDRGLGCSWGEWSVHPDYDKRADLVPKY